MSRAPAISRAAPCILHEGKSCDMTVYNRGSQSQYSIDMSTARPTQMTQRPQLWQHFAVCRLMSAMKRDLVVAALTVVHFDSHCAVAPARCLLHHTLLPMVFTSRRDASPHLIVSV